MEPCGMPIALAVCDSHQPKVVRGNEQSLSARVLKNVVHKKSSFVIKRELTKNC